MSEPPKVEWEGGRRGLAGELIRAGRNERASASARRVALGAFAAASAPAVVQAASWLTLLKWLGLSAFVVSGAGLGWHLMQGPPGAAAARVSTSSSARPATIEPARASSEASVAPLVSAQAVASSAQAKLPVASGARPRASSEAPRDERLRDELALLRAARAALVAGAPTKALALLDSSVGGFRLLPLEAGIVRVEALRAAGDAGRARRLASTLLAQHGSGPYTERLRALARD